jgi:quinol monooxygenase YgiN
MNEESNFQEKPVDIPRRGFLKDTLLAAGVAAIFPFSLNSQNKIMNKYGLYGKLQAQSGKGKELGEILLKAAKLMENAKGCILYLVNKEVGNADSIYIIEVWESKEDHDNSLKVPGVSELIKQALPILAEKPTGGTTLEVLGGKGIS